MICVLDELCCVSASLTWCHGLIHDLNLRVDSADLSWARLNAGSNCSRCPEARLQSTLPLAGGVALLTGMPSAFISRKRAFCKTRRSPPLQKKESIRAQIKGKGSNFARGGLFTLAHLPLFRENVLFHI